MIDTTEILKIEGLSKTFPNGDGVDSFNLHINKGTSFGLLGSNGAGKSTTLKMIMGLIKPSSGSISVFGHNPEADPESVKRLTGYVPEYQNMYPWMSITQLIRFVRSFYPTWDNTLCVELLKDYGLSGAKKISTLSNGMQTKLALVLALSHNPEFLVLDEPTAGLDPLVREEFLEKISNSVHTHNRTVLFSSHIMSDIDEIADTVGIVEKGKMLIVSDRKTLVNETRRIHVEMGVQNGPPIAPAGTICQSVDGNTWNLTVHHFTDNSIEELQARNDIKKVTTTKPHLEEIFKDFVKGARS